MNTKMELRKIAEYQNSLLPRHEKRSEKAISDIVDAAEVAFINSTYDFGNYTRMNLQQDDKQRIVMMYPPFSPEDILCVYLKRVLDRKFHITYPNRNNYMRSVFDTVCALKDMSDFTIYKFDFSDFFNSVSSIYVYQKYIQDKGLERFNAELLKRFVYDTKYTYAGLNTSNILCEIIAKEFDELLMQKLSKSGVILYKRYIDDGIVIFNRYISKDDCLKNVNEAIKSIFYDSVEANIPSCKTKVNSSKSAYISRRLMTVGLYSFDFLGYEFEMSNKVVDGNEKITIRYGITQKKIDKYSKRIADIVKDYATDPNNNMELLRHQVKAFTHRSVYRINRYKSTLWKSKGFISNYAELRYRMDYLTPQTERFLKTVVYKAFSDNGVKMPYFLKGTADESVYSLYNNMKEYRTLLFVEKIGISKETLQKMCAQVGVNNSTDKEYDGLVRDYLIKVKVGH